MFDVYTDGACEPNPGRGGWGFVVYHGGNEVFTDCGGELVTTNNRMEFSGILNAMLWLGVRPATIHTDSRYCLDSLTIWHKKWAQNGWRKGSKKTAEPVKNAELIQQCLRAKHKGHVLSWCKGHSGIEGNERADRLAAQGRSGVGRVLTEPPVHAQTTEIFINTPNELFIRTTQNSNVFDCGCTHVLPWEHCEHTHAAEEAAMHEMLA